jgi:hypothetical protein
VVFLPKKKLLFFIFVVTLMNIFISANAMIQLKLHKDTEHFFFYCTEQDVSCLNELSQKLEENHQRICDDLEYDFKGKIKVEIFPDIQAFHNAIGRPNSPDWSVGSVYNGEIHMTSPLSPGPVHTYNSLLKVIVHEFTHVVVNNIKSGVPRWLNDGLAAFEADQLDINRRNFLIRKIKANQIPKIKDLEIDSVSFGEIGGYQWSYTIIEFVVKNYGWKKVREWIRNYGIIKSTFKISEDEFHKKWIGFLEENYIKTKY